MPAKNRMTTIPVSWNTKRKLEKKKFDMETEMERKLTWDEFLGKLNIVTGLANKNDK